MTNPWIIALRASGSDNRPWITREMRRNEFAGKRFREAGIIAYAELFEGYAEQNRLELEALDKMEQRITALDAKLCGHREDDAEVTASAIAFGGPLPTKGAAA